MRRIFPAYGRELMRLREHGRHPRADELVLVAVNFWPQFGDRRPYWPRHRGVAVFDDVPLARLELRMLAGCTILVAFDRAHLNRARELIPLIATVQPHERRFYLLAFEVGGFFEQRLDGELVDLSETQRSYWQPLAEDIARFASRPQEKDAHAA